MSLENDLEKFREKKNNSDEKEKYARSGSRSREARTIMLANLEKTKSAIVLQRFQTGERRKEEEPSKVIQTD